MSDIFISYSNKDRDRIMPIIRALESCGWSVFWDRTIPTGSTWRQILNHEIDICKCLIVVWSNDSLKAQWVLEEADEGKQRNILFPILIDDVLPPLGFRSIQAGNLVDWTGDIHSAQYKHVIKDLSRIVEHQNSREEQSSGTTQKSKHTLEHKVTSSHSQKTQNLQKTIKFSNRVKFAAIILMLMPIIIGSLLYAKAQSETRFLKRGNNLIEKKIRSLEGKLGNLKEFESVIKDLNIRAEIVKALSKNSININILNFLSSLSVIPQDVQLISIKNEKGQYTIKGVSTSQRALADLVKYLNTLQEIKYPNTLHEMNVKSFSTSQSVEDEKKLFFTIVM
jgi:Tfp pilus assembly protein PilN